MDINAEILKTKKNTSKMNATTQEKVHAPQSKYISGIQGRIKIGKKKKLIHHIGRKKGKINIMIIRDVKNKLIKFQITLLIKKSFSELDAGDVYNLYVQSENNV